MKVKGSRRHNRDLSNDDCDHEWVQWSGEQRCRKCGKTKR